ncbi:RecQ family ATP-dependent DNA helicase [Aneurinibacillus sp. BA2021]|nr:RecQ family ATP-dependent DNA helicase [Aneurinibacillus sp. BA2021]
MHQALRKYFGYEHFRPGQLAIMNYPLEGKNALGILATGGGKSLCYQLPALMFDGMTLVVSPLISLMADQVRQLRRQGIQHTEYINSSLSVAEQRWKLRQVVERRVKILYVSPEKLQQDAFLEQIKRVDISLFVVDEAHCISQWGHDFRTDYQRLHASIQQVGSPPVLALTATATEAVQQDICRQLSIPSSHVVRQSTNRENLCYDVAFLSDEQEKEAMLFSKLQTLQGPGLVYFRSRQSAERALQRAEERGMERCAFYHGGMAADDRLLIQQQFLNGELDIVFATNAFGMGIDKPDIRFVLHYHIPPDIESYLQEVGRVSRDGAPGYTCLLSTPDDGFLPGQLIAEEYPGEGQMLRFAAFLHTKRGQKLPLSVQEVLERWGLEEQHVSILLYHMERMGWLHKSYRKKDGWDIEMAASFPEDHTALAKAVLNRRNERYKKLEDMKRWLSQTSCRRKMLGAYFSEEHHASLASCCDRCGIDMALYERKAAAPHRLVEKPWDWEQELDRLLYIPSHH